jgi:DNA-binding response OmpR family regulator
MMRVRTMNAGKAAFRGGVESQRILIIEDNRDAADTLGEILKLLGHEVRIAYSGLQGVNVASEWGPTIVVSDIGLPELDGFEVARELRGQKKTAGAKLIALTAYGTEEHRRLAVQAGFDAYITKPADLDALEELLELTKNNR